MLDRNLTPALCTLFSTLFSTLLVAVFVLLPLNALHAATDPDGDPAYQIDAEAYGTGGLVVETVKAFLQENEDGESYARLVMTVRNDTEEPVHKHLWRLEGDGFTASSITSGTIQPNAQHTFTQLVFGDDVERLAQTGFVAVGVSQTAQTSGYCHNRGSRESCEASAAELQDACHAGCISTGVGFGGQMICAGYEVRDERGNICTVWESWCQCSSAPTLNEILATGALNLNDPMIRDVVSNPPRVEMRQLFP